MKKILISLCGALCILTAAAQPTTDSLLTRYRTMALDYNDDLKAAAKNIGASIELERAARAERIPTLSAGGDFQYTGNPMELTAKLPGVGPISFQGQHMNYGLSATLLQPVYTGGRIVETIRLAESQQAMAESQQELLRSLVCFQTDVQYWNTVARGEFVEVAADFRNSVGELAHIVRERVEAGLSDPQDLLMAEVKLNEAEYRLLQARSNFETGLMALNSLIGEPLEASTPVGLRVAPVDDAAELLRTDRLRPEVLIAQQGIEIQKSRLRLNDAQYKPQVYVGANGGYSAPGYDFRPDLSPNYTVYARVSIPIFEGGKRRKEKRAAQYRVGMADDNLHKVQTQIELQTRTAWVALSQAVQRTHLASASLEKAQQNERRATEKYEQGAISVAEVIDAQVYRQTAQTNHVESKAAAQMHYAELLKAANGYQTR